MTLHARTPITPTRHRRRHRRLSLARVPRPEQWWIATREDLPLPPRAGDDGPHGVEQHDLPRWAAVAAAVQGVGRALVAGAYTHDPDDPGVVLVPVNVAALDRLGRTIVRSWFHAGLSSPCGDPGAAQPEDRLHWLAHAWDALPNAQLPVRSELLMRVEDVPELGDAFAHVIVHSANDALSHLGATTAGRSPRDNRELRSVAQRTVPSLRRGHHQSAPGRVGAQRRSSSL